jgi:polysaccharide pyruvyl transferase WcaK-like protein
MQNSLVKKILFINDTSDDNNIGCKATSNALFELISERLPNYEINDVIKLFHTERCGIANYIPNNINEFDMACKNWLDSTNNEEINFEMQKLRRCDLVIINGEGSIYKDVLKCRYQLFVAYLAKTYLNKKVYMVNHTAELSLVKSMAQKVYSLFDGIVAREPITQRQIFDLGIQDVVLAPDAVFKYSLPNCNIEKSIFGFDPNKKFLIIGGTSLNHPVYEKWYGGWNRDSFKRMIMNVRESTGVQILLADVGGDDFLRNYDIIDGVFYSKFTFWEYMILCSKALLHISGRHHATCLAAISGCPLIGISANTHKMNGDFELLDWKLPVYNFYSLEANIDNIIHHIVELIDKNHYYREMLQNNVSTIKRKVNLNVDIII